MSDNHFKLLKCGCSAQATLSYGGSEPKAGCGIHDCTEIDESPPDLTNRIAKCSYGGNPVPSSTRLAFFRHHPNKEFDEYYCGCWGWD